MSYIEFLRRACCIFAVIVCSQFAASALAQETVPVRPTRRTLPPITPPAGTPQLGVDQPVGTQNSTEATPQLRPRTFLATPADPVSSQSRFYSVGTRNTESRYQQARQFGAPATTTRRESQVMVIPTREVRSDQFAATSEDLRVMLHILKQETAADRPDRGGVVFSDFGDFFKAQRPSFEALYLQGQGGLFFLEAEFEMASMPELAQAPAAPHAPRQRWRLEALTPHREPRQRKQTAHAVRPHQTCNAALAWRRSMYRVRLGEIRSHERPKAHVEGLLERDDVRAFRRERRGYAGKAGPAGHARKRHR